MNGIIISSNKEKKRKEKIFFRTNPFKNIMSDFAATHNPFNQNLNYEKILRFSHTKVSTFFISPNKYPSFSIKYI